eukprot:TRINITY_DN101474_c0_g1_i1.p1 TRINITY_DN101474_c0_g1~~TRINITY_DN101474_c0_g1_i1.p1  ORF type:complete len:402 (+),score=37.79 TRINITY_DN101474_c0_g1_i1:59-1207(+)
MKKPAGQALRKKTQTTKTKREKTAHVELCPYLQALSQVRQGELLTFIELAEIAGRQGMGGSIHASSTVRKLAEGDPALSKARSKHKAIAAKLPWWRIVSSAAFREPVEDALFPGDKLRQLQRKRLAKEGIRLDVPLQRRRKGIGFVVPKCLASFRADLVHKPRGAHTATIIYLHGYKVGGRRVRMKAEDLPDGVRCVLPTAADIPITSSGGRPQLAWYDYVTNCHGRAEDELDERTLSVSRDRIYALVEKEAKIFGGDWSRVLIGGTSQGCATALDAFVRAPKPLGGFVGVAGHPLSCTLKYLAEGEHKSWTSPTAVWNVNSTADRCISWSFAQPAYRELRQQLAQRNLQLTSMVSDCGDHRHICSAEGRHVGEFLKFVLKC